MRFILLGIGLWLLPFFGMAQTLPMLMINRVFAGSLSKSETFILEQTDWDNNDLFIYNTNRDGLLNDTAIHVFNDSLKDFHFPVPGGINRGFNGWSHFGDDLALHQGDSVVSAFDGVVRYAKFNTGGYGNLVIIRHYNGLETYYAHLSKILVQPDQAVNAGDVVGYGGHTGYAFGAHLHFEVRFRDHPIDPENIFDFSDHQLKTETVAVSASSHYALPVASYTSRYTIIRSGDTLSAIARRNGTSVRNLCALNGIASTTILHPGRSLRIR